MRFIIIASLAVAALSATAFAQDLPPYSAAADSDAIFRTRIVRQNTCGDLRANKSLKTFTEYVHCIYDGYLEALQAYAYPALDLEQERVAAEYLGAEKVDTKRETLAQAMFEESQEFNHINTEYQTRFAALQQQLAQEQTRADERARLQQQADAQTAQLAREQEQAALQQRRAQYCATATIGVGTWGLAGELANGAAAQCAAWGYPVPQPQRSQWPAMAPPPPAPPVNTECRAYAGVVRCTTQ